MVTRDPKLAAQRPRAAGSGTTIARIVLCLAIVCGSYSHCRAQDEEHPASSEKKADPCGALPKDLPLTALTIDISPQLSQGSTGLPEDCAKRVFSDVPILYQDVGISPGMRGGYPFWQGAQFCHRPLYFDDDCLERYGHSHGCFQPAISAVHFFGHTMLMPLKMWHLPPCYYVRTPPPL